MIFKSDLRPGVADISDLRKDPIIQWQHRYYFLLMVIFGYVLPAVIAGALWGDWIGGFFFAGTFRLTVAHHVGFDLCVYAPST
jgi:stearoyl-CoA desaturase (delta-9 desaturase)